MPHQKLGILVAGGPAPGINPGFPIWTSRMGTMLHPRRRLRPLFSSCSVHRLEDGRRDPFQLKLAGTGSVSWHFSDTSPSLLRFFARIRRSAVAHQVGTGSAQIRRSIAPNRRRVR